MRTSGPSRTLAPARRLAEVAERLGLAAPIGDAADLLVTGVCLDSRAIRPGDLYAALPGSRTHGARFAGQAAAAGAVAVLTDPAGEPEAAAAGPAVLVVPEPRAALGGLAAWLFGEPATRLLMLGVTGTNGKTTATFLLESALRHGGRRTGLIGTVETRVAGERLPSVRTTPEAPDLQALLAQMVARGVQACAMEVSSHALALGRVDGVRFDVVGFTNLSRDHLDFHRTMEGYFAAKAELFTPARAVRGVVCVDSDWGRRLADTAGIPVTTLATGGRPADWRVAELRPDPAGSTFVMHGPGGRTVTGRSPLPGEFNVANTALAVVMLAEAGVDAEDAAAWLAVAEPVPGRMERIPGPGRPGEPLVVVDYAHTPDAVDAAVRALRPAAGLLVVVLGAGGDRDAEKRPAMGAAAATADVLVVTDDNPRQEDPAAIRAAVLSGARPTSGTSCLVLEVADRRSAIAEGIARAWGSGTLLVAGKGHEHGQEVAGIVQEFDDRQVVAELLAAGPPDQESR